MLLVSSSCSNSISVSISIRRWITVCTPIGSCCISSLLICTSHCQLFLSLETLFENEWYLVAANYCHCKRSLCLSLSLHLVVMIQQVEIYRTVLSVCVRDTTPLLTFPCLSHLNLIPENQFSLLSNSISPPLAPRHCPPLFLSLYIPLPFSLGLFLS